MRVLATGMDWMQEEPGGLMRYFADYLDAWCQAGESVQGIVRVSGKNSALTLPDYVRGIPSSNQSILSVRKRWQQEISGELNRGGYDVWNPHFAYYAWGAVHQAMRSDISVVTHFHGPWAYESKIEHRGFSSYIRFQMQKAIEQRVYRSSDRFIVLSEAFAQVLEKQYGVPRDRIHVIPGAVDTERFQRAEDVERVRHELGLPKDKTILVSVRRLVQRMGLDRLIHAVAQVIPDVPNLLLVIVGTGDMAAELQQLVRELQLESHVMFAGRVTDEALPMYYQAADLSVVPTVSLEGFGLITAESLACGTPTIGTPVGGTKEILGRLDSRLLFGGTSVSDLRDGLTKAIHGIDRLPSPEACRNYVMEHYTWRATVPQIRDVFNLSIRPHVKPLRAQGVDADLSKPRLTSAEISLDWGYNACERDDFKR